MRCKDDFYVDDLLTGANSKEEASQMVNELNELMSTGGMCLRKWASNEPQILAHLPSDQVTTAACHELGAELNGTISTLGMLWAPAIDSLQVQVKLPQEAEETCTKRQVLACMARIYDPLGFLGPVKMKAKLFIQRIWNLRDEKGNTWNWDKTLPEAMLVEWKTFWSQLSILSEVSVPRKVLENPNKSLECHIFCDASERGYGACCYVRNGSSHETSVRLFVSKSKVAPLSQRLTIAKLELCAALLGSKLYRLVKRALPVEVATTLWTDSMTVWYWINSSHTNWKTFVANRTCKIQMLTGECQWRHVPGKENPADSVSRGIDPRGFIEDQLWWSGPTWLSLTKDKWPAVPATTRGTTITGEERSSALLVSSPRVEGSFSEQLFARYSSYSTLRRIVGYCIRYLQSLRKRTQHEPRSAQVSLTTDELKRAEVVLCRLAQRDRFSEEVKALQTKGEVARNSKLRFCYPYVDEEGVIRINSRIRNSKLELTARYPIVLPRDHPIATLLATHYHVNLLHAGPQLMLTTLRQRYWVLGARTLVRLVHRRCVQCFRTNPKTVEQPMAALPTSRVTEARPFAVSGVDYCGPVFLRGSSRRASPTKAYIAVFVCFVTRAVHLELVSNLTTEAFLAALRRFVSRRGLVSELHSDNGTNFRGAANELNQLYSLLKSSEFQEEVQVWSSEHEVQWKFIPPGAPHFGGLWEAAVRSMKRHLRRVLGNSSVSYEDMTTLLTQVEACLNSRPITPMSDDPSDLEALTPGHFLTGTNMQQVPQVDLRHVPENRLNHWRVTQMRFQHIWERWRVEYLQQLHTRSKWKGPRTNIRRDMMVIIRDDNVPPCKWLLGRITEIHPGKDGIVRVATVRTANSEALKRPVTKLCLLPTQDNAAT